ncbi:MAG: YfhO family protein, partial [Anaerolineae bacterium]
MHQRITSRCIDPPRWQIWLAVLLISLSFFGYLLPDRVFYGGDTARLYLPQQRALSTALQEGALPWWSPDIGAGYPLIAEGETAALYPLNLALHALFAPELVITVSILLHLFLAGLGMAWLAQAIGISRGAALLSAVVYALGGFMIAHTSHLSVVSVSAWLPWLLVLLHRAMVAPLPGKRVAWSLALGAVAALQFYAGHAQMSLLILLPVIGWALFLILADEQRAVMVRRLVLPALGILAGVALAAPQLLATLELAGLSQRAGGLSSVYFTSYSFHPLMTATFVSPFLLGNPYPEGSIELMGYVGLAPLGLSWIALTRGRLKIRWLLAALLGGGLLLAFGRSNPLYLILERIPPINFFRVPARYLLWTSAALALLAGMGLDRLDPGGLSWRHTGALLAGLALTLAATAVVLAAQTPDADALVALWRWLPLVHAAAFVVWLIGARAQTRGMLLWIGLAILCADLYTYGVVLNRTYSQSWPLSEVREEPAIFDLLRSDQALYRVWTKESILPVLSVQRESLYPNIAATYGVSGANMYMPLVPRTYQSYVALLDAERLNRLNVRYYVIPQLLPVDPESELYDVLNPYAALDYGVVHPIAVNDVVEIHVESYVSHAADMANGELAATLVLQAEDGSELAFPIRVGIETAEWAIERGDVAEMVRHDIAPLASTFPARSSYRNVAHPGHTYLASWKLDPPADLESLQIEPSFPDAYIRIERVRFVTASGAEILASHLLGLGDHAIVYRTEDALVYENRDAWPRAYTVPMGQV